MHNARKHITSKLVGAEGVRPARGEQTFRNIVGLNHRFIVKQQICKKRHHQDNEQDNHADYCATISAQAAESCLPLTRFFEVSNFRGIFF